MADILKLRALNNEGIQRFAEFITQTREAEFDAGKRLASPDNLLTDSAFLEPTDYDTEINRTLKFRDRFELGEYLVSKLGKGFIDLYYNVPGVWAWLALVWFDQLRGRKTQRHEHFIPYEWFKNPLELFGYQALSYRHSVRSSFEVVARFGKNGRFFASPKGVAFFGDASEQLLSEQRIRSSAKLRELLFELYQDTTGFMKKGALDKVPRPSKAKGSKAGYGGIRRLTDAVLPRVKLTYDIDLMPTNHILKICGPEFSVGKFKPSRQRNRKH